MDGPYRSPGRPRPAHARCPRCRAATLDARAIGPTAVLACGRCHGMWLDARALADLLIEIDRQAAVLALPPQQVIRRAPAALACPRCRAALERRPFRDTGIELDLCRRHGCWFDAGELRAAVTQVATQSGPPLPDLADPSPTVSRWSRARAPGPAPLTAGEVRQALFPTRGLLGAIADGFAAMASASQRRRRRWFW